MSRSSQYSLNSRLSSNRGQGASRAQRTLSSSRSIDGSPHHGPRQRSSHVIRAVWRRPHKQLRDDPASVLSSGRLPPRRKLKPRSGSNSVPSSQMRCKMTASLRATAVLARWEPIFALSFSPKCEASFHAALLSSAHWQPRTAGCARDGHRPWNPPCQIDLARLVASWCQPRKAPTSLECRKRSGSSMAVKKVRAVIAPTPGTVTMRRHVALPRARRTSWSSSALLRSRYPPCCQ